MKILLHVFILIIILFSNNIFAENIVILADSNFLTIRQRTDKFDFNKDINKIEYSVYKYNLDGDFRLSWKFYNTLSSHGLLDTKGERVVTFKNLNKREDGSVFLMIHSKNGLLKQFTLKDIFEVNSLKMTKESFPHPQLILLSEYHGISHKHNIKMFADAENKKKIMELLNEDEEYLYYVTSQDELIIHGLTDGDIIHKSHSTRKQAPNTGVHKSEETQSTPK